MGAKSSETSGSSDKWPRYRSRHRERSHDAAHAETIEGSHAANDPISHPLVPSASPELVSSADGLKVLIDHLRSSGCFGYDSEFIGEQSYFPELCLIQVATSERIALIDPLHGLDLTPFWELLADDRVEKVVHAGLPDLEPVARHLGRSPQRIFDSQIAAAFAGLDYPMALGKLVATATGAPPPTSSRNIKFSKWNHRPLSAAQVRYAADDVRYLPLLRHSLLERLSTTGHTTWAIEECGVFSDERLYRLDPATQRIRIRGVEKLNRRKSAVLHALIVWRDAAAREQNVPPRTLLRDDVLYALANAPVQSVADLDLVSGLPRPVEERYGETIVNATATALALPPSADTAATPQGGLRIDHDQRRQLVADLWTAIGARCVERSVHAGIVTSKRELDGFIRTIERGQSTEQHRLTTGWRRELLDGLLPIALQ